jgi:hypothetical protein
MTKKEYRQQRAAWKAALADGRVLKVVVGVYPERTTLTSYPTLEARDSALAKSDGLAQIVKVLPDEEADAPAHEGPDTHFLFR